jgi:hypothetical protein
MRRLALVGFLALAVVVIAAGCNGNDDGSARDDTSLLCEENGVSVTIVDNHPTGSHILAIPASDVAAGVESTYDIQGNNTGHGHTVTVTAEDFAALDDGMVVNLTSSDTGAVGMSHTHNIVLDCNP